MGYNTWIPSSSQQSERQIIHLGLHIGQHIIEKRQQLPDNNNLSPLQLRSKHQQLLQLTIGAIPLHWRNRQSVQGLESMDTTKNFSTFQHCSGPDFNRIRIPIPENIQLAGPDFSTTDNIDILLGVEYYLELSTTCKICLSSQLPTLKNTKLCSIISGKLCDILTEFGTS